MTRRPPRSTRTDTLFPYTTLFRSAGLDDLAEDLQARDEAVAGGGVIRQDDVPRLLAADIVAVAAHRLQHMAVADPGAQQVRSEEHTSGLQSLMLISYAVFCLKKKKPTTPQQTNLVKKQHQE